MDGQTQWQQSDRQMGKMQIISYENGGAIAIKANYKKVYVTMDQTELHKPTTAVE